ncbi:ATP-binding cassette domain-containing protein [Leptospira langatensis]|uniref:ATP-binding cassette domain-containing protein n=1 Tax=Leptospira langatensis TaxID=2484983 RepID=A0A5F1ZTH2_9LEPT|nr:ATP-binding cassette domain-containing protein [Leptospira langatensis]TGK02660.1 ATP-binding cassette domain-containing protein [Leptospira langatensis]TGL40138.1 ATP-binding cassette domain-containing protein [Leptospira langatensis]
MIRKEEPILVLEDVSLFSAERTYLSKIDLKVSSGEFLGILGRSGSGKSTLLRYILDLPFPSSWKKTGRVLFFGKEKKEIPARWIQPVFQDPVLGFNPTWTVEKSLREPLRLFKEEERFASLLEKWNPILDLDGKNRDRLPASFSGGELQRFSLLRALLCEPKILLLDEATSALDPLLNEQVLEALSDLNRKEGTTILWVTHNVRSAKKFCSRTFEILSRADQGVK